MDYDLPIAKEVIFLETVPNSSELSTSKIGIQVEPLTHACQNRNIEWRGWTNLEVNITKAP